MSGNLEYLASQNLSKNEGTDNVSLPENEPDIRLSARCGTDKLKFVV